MVDLITECILDICLFVDTEYRDEILILLMS
jgi:hypothetical protein